MTKKEYYSIIKTLKGIKTDIANLKCYLGDIQTNKKKVIKSEDPRFPNWTKLRILNNDNDNPFDR